MRCQVLGLVAPSCGGREARILVEITSDSLCFLNHGCPPFFHLLDEEARPHCFYRGQTYCMTVRHLDDGSLLDEPVDVGAMLSFSICEERYRVNLGEVTDAYNVPYDPPSPPQ